MSKYTKTIKKNNIRTVAVSRLAEKHDVTISFVNMALRGDRDSQRALEIKKEFKKIYAAVEAAIN